MNNILYFSKEGYPHNFQYNYITDSYEGKIIFDENSSDVFKTQSLHIFENVQPVEFGCMCNLLKINYFNYSGLTITGEVTYKNEIITNITKVNESNEFYSKWITGDNFHKKFPIGTIITFSGVTGTATISGTTDFTEDQYFTVLSIRKNSIMIITNSSNDLYNMNFNSGYIKQSLNVISINNYNRNLSGDTFFQNLYSDKKLSILNSDFNDSIIGVKQSGISYSYLNNLKLNGVQGQRFTLRIQLFTERPKIYQGNVNLLKNNINVTTLNFAKINSNFEVDKDIIFLDYSGGTLFSGYTFLIKKIIDSTFIGQKKLTFKKYYQVANTYKYNSSLTNTIQWNTIQFPGYLSINKGDIIKLSGITGSELMHNREFTISEINYSGGKTTIFTVGYIINESGSTYNIDKLLKPSQLKSIEVESSGFVANNSSQWALDANCYTTSTTLDFIQTYLSGNTSTINSFIQKYNSTLNQYGINAYSSNADYLSIESMYGTKNNYFYASGFTNSTKIADDFTLSNNGITERYDIITNEKLISEKTNRSESTKLSKNATAEIYLNINYDTTGFGFRLTLNSNQYYAKFTGDTITTINTFIDYYKDILYGNGFYVSSGTTYSGYTLNLITITPDIDIWNLEMMVGILSSYSINEHQRNKGILLSGNEITTNSGNFFDAGLSTGMVIKISGSSAAENNKEYNIIGLTSNIICLSYQSTFIAESNVSISGKSREFIRKPRGEYNKDIYYKVYWKTPSNNNIDNSIFLYDISGSQLTPYNNIESLKYIGQTPLVDPLLLNPVLLNNEPNKDITRISNPKYQQTVFDELNFKLEQLDSSKSYNWIPEPLEIFIGYNTSDEGVNSRILKIDKIEKFENSDIQFNYSGYTLSGSTTINNFYFQKNELYYDSPQFNFISYGFEKDQLITFDFIDQSKNNQIIFENILTYKILDISRNKIIIDSGYTGSGFTYFTSTGSTFKFNIEVQPKEILNCVFYGQTEIEDIRFKVNLNNVGVQLEEDVYQILYASDIEDNAIDYTLFNQKRKEMLTSFREIYDYIGSYKALINAINFFGYNNLQLFEYYKNINQASSLYGKLHKVLIPDIFDNTVEGWNEIDFIAGKYQNQTDWKKSNLFNLAYQITDEEGNNVLIYTLAEVQYKLTKLKTWLRKNIIPISANLLDITGVANSTQTLYQDYDESNQVTKSVINRNSSVVNFNYTASLNFGSDYLITVNFYILSGVTGTIIDYNEEPTNFTAKIKTFYLSGDTMIPVQYHKIIKNDLSPYSFNLDKLTDPYIYIETTAYDNDGCGVGFINNKMFYFDEPRNHWIVNHNFDMRQMKYWQTKSFVNNQQPDKWTYNGEINYNDYLASLKTSTNLSTIVNSSVETNVKVNTLNNTYLSNISNN